MVGPWVSKKMKAGKTSILSQVHRFCRISMNLIMYRIQCRFSFQFYKKICELSSLGVLKRLAGVLDTWEALVRQYRWGDCDGYDRHALQQARCSSARGVDCRHGRSHGWTVHSRGTGLCLSRLESYFIFHLSGTQSSQHSRYLRCSTLNMLSIAAATVL